MLETYPAAFLTLRLSGATNIIWLGWIFLHPDRHVRPRDAASDVFYTNADAALRPGDGHCHLKGATKT